MDICPTMVRHWLQHPKDTLKKNSYGFDKSFYVFVMIKVVNYD